MRAAISVTLILVVGLALSCERAPSTPEELAARYYGHVARLEFPRAAALHSREFRGRLGRRGEPWSALLNEVHAKLGDVRDFRLRDRSVGLTEDRQSRSFTLVYEVSYSHHSSFEEILVVRRPTDGRLEIADHRIRSPWLSDLVEVGQNLAARYFAAIRDARFDEVGALYVDGLRHDELRRELDELETGQEQLGPLVRYRLVDAEKHPGRSLERDLVLVYDVDYAGKALRQRLWIRRKLTDEVGIAGAWVERELAAEDAPARAHPGDPSREQPPV